MPHGGNQIMTKKELEKEVKKLDGKLNELIFENSELRMKLGIHIDTERALGRREGAKDKEREIMLNQIRVLRVRLDVLTMTPEQIVTIQKIKNKRFMTDPDILLTEGY